MEVPYSIKRLSAEKMAARATQLRDELSERRTIRDFSEEPVPLSVIDACLEAANTAPNGANLQPWHFVVVTEPTIKTAIREGAEAEERAFYEKRATEEWLKLLRPLGTDSSKPFLEKAPVLIAIFQRSKVEWEDGTEVHTHYPKESTGIACGFLIAALHQAGLGTLTHTPSPMQFLNLILERPASEKPFLLLVVGYPAAGCTVPAIQRRPSSERVTWK